MSYYNTVTYGYGSRLARKRLAGTTMVEDSHDRRKKGGCAWG
jgi:hypothetical protein